MRKCDELKYEDSCWNKARHDERLFILLQRDLAFAAAVRAWAAERVRLAVNKPDDPQIREALVTADAVAAEQRG